MLQGAGIVMPASLQPDATVLSSTMPLILLVVIVLLFILVFALSFYCWKLLNYKKLTSVLPIEAGICDEAGNVLYYSDETSGGSAAMPESLRELPVELQTEFEKILPEVFSKQVHKSVEVNVFRTCRKIDFSPLPDSLYGCPTVMWLSTNITELHQAYTQCAQTAQRFQRTVSSIGDAVVVINYDCEITLLNKVAETLSGYKKEAVIGKKFDEYFVLHTSDGQSPAAKSIRRNTEFDLNTTLRCKGRAEILIEGKISPIVEKDDLVIGAVACFRDVTEIELQRKQLQSALDFAESADQAKSDFIAMLSHEFRGSLAAIVGYTELLGMDLKDSERDFPEIVKIRTEGETLMKLLDDILDFSKKDSGDRKIVMEPFNLKELLREIQRIFITTSETRGTSFFMDCLDLDFPLFISDPRILRQVLIRVLSSFFLRLETGEVRFSVSWNAPELRLRVFSESEIFSEKSLQSFELESSIVRRLLLPLNGDLILSFADHTLSAEITFRNLQSRTPETASELLVVEPRANLPKRDVILLVDDVPVNLILTERMLQSLHISCVCCSSAQAAMREIEQYTPAAVFTDLWMPVQCGDELARHLRANPETASIPVVLITADSEADEQIRSVFDCVIVKPLKINKLKEVVQKVVPRLLNSGAAS